MFIGVFGLEQRQAEKNTCGKNHLLERRDYESMYFAMPRNPHYWTKWYQSTGVGDTIMSMIHMNRIRSAKNFLLPEENHYLNYVTYVNY